MGELRMSVKERRRLELLARVRDKQVTLAKVAEVLALSSPYQAPVETLPATRGRRSGAPFTRSPLGSPHRGAEAALILHTARRQPHQRKPRRVEDRAQRFVHEVV